MATICLLMLAIFANERAYNILMLEANAHLNELITDPNSTMLGPLNSIRGAEPNLTSVSITQAVRKDVDAWFTSSQTQALIVQQHGEVLYEAYSSDTQRGLNVNGMSMAKNIIAMLVGIAIEEGLIGSEKDPVITYVPELNLADASSPNIRDLLRHTSGIQSTLSDIQLTLKNHLIERPLGAITFSEKREFHYDNMNYYLLNLILSRVYKKEINEIIEDEIWRPMELDRAQIINKTGYCCLFATARSWLAIGSLYLNRGRYEGEQIVPAQWLEKMVTDTLSPPQFYVQATNRSTDNRYGYHIYSGMTEYPDFFWLEGMGLQLIMINPETQTIIVRLGGIPSFFKSPLNYSRKSLSEEIVELFVVTSQ
jgi:CubicO group peptidase (beta-lactamase class C family)